MSQNIKVIDQLDLHILVRHHPGHRQLRREGIIAHIRRGIRQRGQELRLSGIGRAHQHHLPRPELVDVVVRLVGGALLLALLDFLPGL